jgi:PAS domain S-box-containing protein
MFEDKDRFFAGWALDRKSIAGEKLFLTDMQTLRKRFSVVAGFTLLLLLLVANAWITKRQLNVQLGNQDWVVHTEEVRVELAQTESLLKDAETGQRGFLYTGDRKYLRPYNQAITQIGSHLDRLAQLTVDNPMQRAHIAVLRDLAQKKLSELAQSIDLYQSGNSAGAKALVLSDLGFHLMTDIRTQVEAMRQEELSLQAARSTAYVKSVRVTIACIYLASLVAAFGSALLAYFILREMDLRERHAAQLREREEWFRVTLTSLGDAVIATDENGDVIFLNPVAEQLTGWTLALAKGKPIETVFPIFNEFSLQPVENPVKKVMEMGKVIGLANHTVLRGAGDVLTPIEDSAAPIRDDRGRLTGVVLVFRDAGKERKSQEIMRRAEKLAAAARLAATFAHEINNPLEAVVNLVYIAKRVKGLPQAAVQPLEMAEQELERISHIARQTLGFYREPGTRGPVDLTAVIETVVKLYRNKLQTKRISVERDFSPCPPVEGLVGELTQAIANLISNAADAVDSGGTIRVQLVPTGSPPGQIVQLAVVDDGQGIKPELAEKIFEPFFTTKEDVGTGLGLWVVKEIVERHRGRIEMQSPIAGSMRGAAFRLLLPSALDKTASNGADKSA